VDRSHLLGRIFENGLDLCLLIGSQIERLRKVSEFLVRAGHTLMVALTHSLMLARRLGWLLLIGLRPGRQGQAANQREAWKQNRSGFHCSSLETA
jgi:hypothetical protein